MYMVQIVNFFNKLFKCDEKYVIYYIDLYSINIE